MSDQLTTVFAALADPTRRAILHRLTQGDANVAALAEPFAMSQPAVSRHLKVLEGAGLISRSRVATARFSHLEAEPLKEATEYMERYRHFWDTSFDRLDEALAAYQSAAAADLDEPAPKARTKTPTTTPTKSPTKTNEDRNEGTNEHPHHDANT